MIVRVKSPWAVICKEDGQVFLTAEEYEYQMNRPDHLWYCPICTGYAYWDDDNYDSAMEELERLQSGKL